MSTAFHVYILLYYYKKSQYLIAALLVSGAPTAFRLCVIGWVGWTLCFQFPYASNIILCQIKLAPVFPIPKCFQYYFIIDKTLCQVYILAPMPAKHTPLQYNFIIEG